MGVLAVFLLLTAGWGSAADSVSPADAVSSSEELGWSLDEMETRVTDLALRFTARQMQDDPDPLSWMDPEVGIGPGSEIRMEFPDGSGAGCSANFIWSDTEGNLYLGTAGHCLVPSGVNGTHGPGADYDASGVVVKAAVKGCILKASTFLAALGGCVEKGFETEMVELGPVVYATRGVVGHDFGLVLIPPSVHELLRYELPRWGGPEGEGGIELGDTVLHYGRGLGWEATPATRARAAYGLGDFLGSESIWIAAGGVNSGDSGSGAVVAREDSDAHDPRGGTALGVITHAAYPPAGIMFGTMVHAAKQDVLCHLGLSVWVVPGGEPLTEVPEGMDCDPPPSPGDVSASFAYECDGLVCTFDASDSFGPITRYDWDFGDGSNASATEPVVVHEFAQSDLYEVALEVIADDGRTDRASRSLNMHPFGALYLTAQPVGDDFTLNSEFDLSNQVPTGLESSKAYVGPSTPAATFSSSFYYDVEHPFLLEGDLEVSFWLSCDGASVGLSPIWTVTMTIRKNGDIVGAGSGAPAWVCAAGMVTPVELTMQDLHVSYEPGDTLTFGLALWGTNPAQMDLHLLVDSTVHPSRVQGRGLPGLAWDD